MTNMWVSPHTLVLGAPLKGHNMYTYMLLKMGLIKSRVSSWFPPKIQRDILFNGQNTRYVDLVTNDHQHDNTPN